MEATTVAPTQRTYWTHVGTYTIGTEYPSWDEAVAAARQAQEPFSYGGQSRQMVELRIVEGHGSDRPLARWEVYPESVGLVPKGQGGMTEAQRTSLWNQTQALSGAVA